jgi:hypothetical protein
MTRFRAIFSWMVCAVVAVSAMAAPVHHAVTSVEIAAAMQSIGMQITSDQVTLLSDVVASTENPRLTVKSMQHWDDGRVMVRMECANREECLPFFVGLRLSQEDKLQTSALAADRPASLQSRAAPANSPTVKTGSPATLLLDGDHVHIRLAVICLQNGMAGQTIRATSKDHRVVYTAEVVDGGLLKGQL